MNINIKKLIFLILSAAIPLTVFISSYSIADMEAIYYDTGGGSTAILAERLIRRGIPFREELLWLNGKLGSYAGRHEIVPQSYGYPAKQNGIFVGGDSLMKNIDPPIEAYVRENTEGVVKIAENMRQYRVQTYLMLLPTSGAILQQNLPYKAQSVMVNQLKFIEDVYGGVSVGAITIDAYSALIARQNQYIYYRTENNLTSLGGFFVYSAMLTRMAIGKAEFNQFDIDYADSAFYGNLCEETAYTDIKPDVISLFKYSEANRAPREFLVTRKGGGQVKTYHTLFPEQAAVFGKELDIFMGGMSALTDIKTSLQHAPKILVFGDKTAIAYIPFLANNASRVTLVDLFYDKSEFDGINPEDYDKIVFAYSVESFMHTNNPSRAVKLLTE